MRTYRDLHPLFDDRTNWDLPHVLRTHAERYGDRVFLDVPGEGTTATFAEMQAAADRVAAGLLDRGAQPGNRLLIMAENSHAYIDAWFGASVGGLVEVPINTSYRGAFLEHQVQLVAPRYAVVDPELAGRFAASREACRSIERFFLLAGDDQTTVQATAQLEEAGWKVEPFDALRTHEPHRRRPEPAPSSLGAIFFTSGTTGLSKGVMMSHSHLHFYAETGRSLTRLGPDDAYMSVGPLFHGNAQFLATYPALIAGARLVLQRRFSASSWLDWVREGGVTVTNFIGVMMEFVWNQPRTPRDADNALRCIFSAPTASSILDAFKARFGIEAFVECFGLTEVSLPILTPYGVDRPAGAAGLLVEDWFDIKLVDSDSDDEVPVGEVGELVVRHKVPFTICSGYYGMPDKTVEAWRNLWFHTGDGLRRDAEGWYYFVDRLKDALRRRGENISSYEVEQPILAHPDIAECAVVAVPAEQEAGEDEVMAFVVPRSGAALSPEEVWAWCDDRLPAFTVPRYVRFIDVIPRTPTEKVRKTELRAIGVDAETHDRRRR